MFFMLWHALRKGGGMEKKMISKERAKIFVVDDDPYIAEMYTQTLQNLGCRNVTVYRDGESCVKDIHTNPDLIFLDQNMNALSGIRVLKIIRKFEYTTNVVLITSDESVGLAMEAIRYGAHDYIIKGLSDQERIHEVINELFLEELPPIQEQTLSWLN
jgi:DNA-binding NtrC family response regulator